MKIANSVGNVSRYHNMLMNENEHVWVRRGEKNVLKLFHSMSVRVPAYKDYLKRNKISPDKIKTVHDLKLVPPVDKVNYLRYYPRHMLCWDGKFTNSSWVISTTSGSTGEPFYFPRQVDQDLQYATTAELYLLSNFEIDKRSTLYIDGFAMGAWIGGLFTYQAIKYVAERGKYNLSIITPGIFKKEIIKAVRNLGHEFDQVIIGGYPPFIKATIDEGVEEGLVWSDYNLKFIFSAEGFNETFRDYIIDAVSLKNPYKDTLNHYGTVDLGTMAHETPLSILVRRLAITNKHLYKSLFSDINRTPTLTQYLPEMFYFEDISGSLLASAYSGIPLVRYDLKDHGGILHFNTVEDILRQNNINLTREISSARILNTIWKLPFVYVYERADFVVKLYGANIYPETIRKALQNKELINFVTGRFTMLIQYDGNQNQYLEINVELKSKTKKSAILKRKLQTIITHKLLKENSEYKSNYKEAPERQIPEIVIWDYEDPLYFRSGVKQRWVKK